MKMKSDVQWRRRGLMTGVALLVAAGAVFAAAATGCGPNDIVVHDPCEDAPHHDAGVDGGGGGGGCP